MTITEVLAFSYKYHRLHGELGYSLEELVQHFQYEFNFATLFKIYKAANDDASMLYPLLVLKSSKGEYKLNNLVATTKQEVLTTTRRSTDKYCPVCEDFKPLSAFNHRGRYTYRSDCRLCQASRALEYNKTLPGMLSKIYDRQVHGKLHKTMRLQISRAEFIAYWSANSEFMDLYDGWVNSGYEKANKPTLRRKDRSKPITLDNLKLTVFGGSLVHIPTPTSIIRFHLQTKEIMEHYPTYATACVKHKHLTPKKLKDLLSGNIRQNSSFHWRYATEAETEQLKKG